MALLVLYSSRKNNCSRYWNPVITTAVAWWFFLAPGFATDSIEPSKIEFFETYIRPVLVEQCYECHSAQSEEPNGGLRLDTRTGIRSGGDSGAAIVPGRVEASRLIDAISFSGDFYDMPPKGKLPEVVIARFRRWIEMGAPDPREGPHKALKENEHQRPHAKDLWSLQPIKPAKLPVVSDPAWPVQRIDHFVLKELERQGLQPAPPAHRHTLLRRITFDLTGLPPTPLEINEFVGDQSPDAFEKVVERLLTSEAFGDHWARHWLDLACYADTGDADGNVLIGEAWRYRDYVIEAFNSDKPFDQFIREQVAGDLLSANTSIERREQIVATGFLAIGPWTLQNYIKGQLAADVVDHQIEKIGRIFLGMSLGCARCHDHKFDPVPTRDYYALAGIFHSTLTTRHDGPGVWSRIVPTILPESEVHAGKRKASLREFEQKRQQIKDRQQSLQQEPLDGLPSPTANQLTLKEGLDANTANQFYEISFEAGPSVWADRSQATSENDGLVFEILRSNETVLHRYEYTPQPWSGQSQAQSLEPAMFKYKGDGTGPVRLRIKPRLETIGRFGGAVDQLVWTTGEVLILREDFNSLTLTAITGRQPDTHLTVYAGVQLPGWLGAGINHSHAVKIGEKDYAIQFFGGNPPVLADETRKELAELASQLQVLEFNKPKIDEALALRDVETPRDSPIYIRGDFNNHGNVIPRGFLSAIRIQDNFQVNRATSGRRELAEWLIDPENPLTPRVLVNRIWQKMFGQGLVRTVDYLGTVAEPPSHPALLDDLAARFIRRDSSEGESPGLAWSLKGLIREIALSRSYRMSSDNNAAGREIDPDNRLFWRMNRRRLEAEEIRDGLLSVSGRLNPHRSGPSLALELVGNVAGIGGNANPPTYTGAIVPEAIATRRTIYQAFARKRPAALLEILSVFDFPNRNEITGQRDSTTVPTQALFLLNSPYVKAAAQQTASRLLARDDLEDRQRVEYLRLMVFNRPSDRATVERDLEFVREYSAAYATSENPLGSPRVDGWTQYCHALLISNEFLFLE
ncbi:MAG: PSD1 and planctomycete cytochrome C domain-containing protein [Pirellulaceae bacterium]|nr:PSD1 and planctomycete cytochrome C domain-containing protein [Pirellulaceae bacterium]